MEFELTESACPQQPMVRDAEMGTCESESTATVVGRRRHGRLSVFAA